MLKKTKYIAFISSVIILYVFIFFSFILLSGSESTFTSPLQSENQFIFPEEIIQQQSTVHDINTEFAEIREKEEDDKDEKHLNFEFIQNSAYSLFSLIHQRFKSKLYSSNADKISALPTYILLCTYRL